MPLAIVRLTPSDYDIWHAVHIESVRRFRDELTLISDVIYRDANDPHSVVVVMEIESIEKYQTFTVSETHAELVSKAKVEAPPTFWFVDKVEEVDLSAS